MVDISVDEDVNLGSRFRVADGIENENDSHVVYWSEVDNYVLILYVPNCFEEIRLPRENLFALLNSEMTQVVENFHTKEGNIHHIQGNLSVTTTSKIKCIICDLYSNVL